jgi:3',5'-cyclic AMP phosphodiesterase CpdA
MRLKLNTLTTLTLFMGLAYFGCGKNLATILFHPSVEDRVADSLSGRLQAPATITVTNPASFKFAMFGDIQIRAENKTTLTPFKTEVTAKNIDFFVVLGDLTEDGTVDEFTKVKTALDSVGIPYYATIGNHDLFQSGSNGGWTTWQSVFGPATYSVTIANAVRFLFLDSASGDIGQSQFTWLETQLKNTVPFNIVGTHYPIYDGMNPLIWRLASAEERYKLTDLLMRYNVSSYVAGHIHGFKQTQVGTVNHLITGSMYPYELDYGERSYALFTYDHGNLTWQQVTF